jgi:hypothetical protein
MVNREFVLRDLKLSVLSADYGADLDGNGKADNQLGKVFSALMSQGFNFQSPVDQAVSAGSALLSFTLVTPQSDLTIDQTADCRVVRALGTGEADPMAVPVSVPGALKGGQFISKPPTVGSNLITCGLPLGLGPGLPVRLGIQWPRIQFTVNPAGTHLLAGRINGSISGNNVADDLIPSLANTLTLYIATSPDSETSRTIKKLFDTGGCTNPDGSPAKANDGVISPCELSQNPLIKALFAPDLQMRDASGKYKPVPNGTQKDSLSLGFGFIATNPTLA